MILAWQLPLAAGEEEFIKLIFIIVIIVGGLIVQMIKKFKGETTDEEQTGRPSRPAPPSRPVAPPTRPYAADSEEIRKFLEALGKPRTAPPPPPVLRPIPQRPPKPPPRPVVVQEEGEGEEGPRNIITGESTRQPFKPMERIDLGREMEAVEAGVEAAVMQAPTPMPALPVASLPVSRAAQFAKWMASKPNVRQAVVLAEIIGPPKAFG